MDFFYNSEKEKKGEGRKSLGCSTLFPSVVCMGQFSADLLQWFVRVTCEAIFNCFLSKAFQCIGNVITVC
jgi:hypothetical protein